MEEKKDSLQEELLAYGIQSLKAERERVRNLDQERERLEIERNRMYRQQTEVEQILGRAQEEWKNDGATDKTIGDSAYLKEKVTQKQEQIRAKIGQRRIRKFICRHWKTAFRTCARYTRRQSEKRRGGEFTETK